MNFSLEGKTYVIMGVANKRSLAWGIAKTLDEAGADLIFTYANERFEKPVRQLAETLKNKNSRFYLCDVTNDESIDQAFETIGEDVGSIAGLAHCIAFADKNDLKGEFIDTSRDGYLLAHNISAYSLVAVTRRAEKLMTDGGKIVTLTYLGGERVVQNYNVMGVAKASLDATMKYLANDIGKKNIRINAISAGPIRTLSAKGVGDFNSILKDIEEKAPLRKAVTQEDVGANAYYLLSDLSNGVTGEIIHVDSGYSILGLV
ncbi:enoyl-[acyl-carrier-protein] reductase [NADH] [Streptohalobacillus salinus]|uniref:Enoyl-[acyl-carrier-protein] reductase [NADH] n=1 Tax=Streptohalobacillus salinus TaxID=621096 RepID=A0A2V3WKD8_9BACI|nr:enoyl-ACP reductase FabI [Streptohalobacillus salinus]PXW93138.1 enoyl-[acyl-carrier-protein] reductase [NADH] [Streptohalobacillus salinus]